MSSTLTPETFRPILSELIQALNFNDSEAQEKLKSSEIEINNLGKMLRNIMTEREQTRSDHELKQEEYRLAQVRGSSNKKMLWKEIDDLENKFFELKDHYLEICQSIVEHQNIESQLKNKIALKEKFYLNYTNKVDLLSIVEVKFKYDQVKKYMLVPDFLKSYYHLEIDTLSSKLPISKALMGATKDAELTYVLPNGLRENIQILGIELPPLGICESIYQYLYHERIPMGQTFRTYPSIDRTHRDRSIDGARENWLLQCSTCKGFNGRDHHCGCRN